jgi:hypothetical protein
MSFLHLEDKPAEIVLAAAIFTVVEFQKNISEADRVELWQLIATGYCTSCGSRYLPCNDCNPPSISSKNYEAR